MTEHVQDFAGRAHAPNQGLKARSRLEVVAGAKGTVLVVDDEDDIRTALMGFLQASLPGVTVIGAADGVEALEVLKTTEADLMVVDYKMPRMDGLALAVHTARLKPDMPRIMLTAYPDTQLAIRAVNEGQVDHFLTKPVDPPHLLEVVRTFLTERRSSEARKAALARSLEELRKRQARDARGHES